MKKYIPKKDFDRLSSQTTFTDDDIFDLAVDIVKYFEYHNINLTQKQMWKVDELEESLETGNAMEAIRDFADYMKFHSDNLNSTQYDKIITLYNAFYLHGAYAGDYFREEYQEDYD